MLGFGKQGRAAHYLLAKKGIEVDIADFNEENLDYAKKNGIKSIKADLSSKDRVKVILKNYSCAVCTLPARLGRSVQETCIEEGKNLVDLSYSEENPLELNDMAREAGVTVIPDTGIAPGISNLIMGYLDFTLKDISMLKILVGGFPEKPIPPMGYSVTWSCEDLIDEYVRTSRIVRNGAIVEEKALTGIEDISYNSSYPLEAFYTDGLRTLLYTIKNSKNIEEKTVRYKGHAEKMAFLRDMGYFEEEKNGVFPKKTTIALFNSIKSNLKDVLFMRVYGDFIKNEKPLRKSFTFFDKGTDRFSAMERTTGFACASFAYMLYTGRIKEKGVICPEILGHDEKIVLDILQFLKDENISIEENEAPPAF